jgi:hypothetical protein
MKALGWGDPELGAKLVAGLVVQWRLVVPNRGKIRAFLIKPLNSK